MPTAGRTHGDSFTGDPPDRPRFGTGDPANRPRPGPDPGGVGSIDPTIGRPATSEAPTGVGPVVAFV